MAGIMNEVVKTAFSALKVHELAIVSESSTVARDLEIEMIKNG